jgi:hypothetical protein
VAARLATGCLSGRPGPLVAEQQEVGADFCSSFMAGWPFHPPISYHD